MDADSTSSRTILGHGYASARDNPPHCFAPAKKQPSTTIYPYSILRLAVPALCSLTIRTKPTTANHPRFAASTRRPRTHAVPPPFRCADVASRR